MARPRIEVVGNQRKSIVSKYRKGLGLVALAATFRLSVPVIRRTLEENDVTIRGRGRPALQT